MGGAIATLPFSHQAYLSGGFSVESARFIEEHGGKLFTNTRIGRGPHLATLRDTLRPKLLPGGLRVLLAAKLVEAKT